MTSKPLFDFDKSFNKTIVGTDEAGRGPGAGGVFAAAVNFDKITEGLITDLAILNDSKKLTAKKRDSIFDVIKNSTINKIVCVEVDEIERINILNASLKAMNIACSDVIERVGKENVLTLVDGNKLIRDYIYPQNFVIKGDAKSASIAAASILAKVYRDSLMKEYAKKYPHYSFEENAGYGTTKHIEGIKEFGTCDIHRMSFLKNILCIDL